MSVLTQRLRRLARAAERSGGTWRDAVDGVRPHVRHLWRALPPAERARFLRHAATWWDVHRYRLAPQVEAVIARLLAAQQRIPMTVLSNGQSIIGDIRPGDTQVASR